MYLLILLAYVLSFHSIIKKSYLNHLIDKIYMRKIS